MKNVQADFTEEIKKRFAFILDLNDSKFDQTFIIASFLDPNYCWLLDRDEYNALGLLKLSVS